MVEPGALPAPSPNDRIIPLTRALDLHASLHRRPHQVLQELLAFCDPDTLPEYKAFVERVAAVPAVAATPFSTTSNAVVTALFRNVLTGPGRSRNTVSSSLLANEPASTPGTSVTRIECVSAPRGVVVRCLIRRETASVQYDQSRRKA